MRFSNQLNIYYYYVFILNCYTPLLMNQVGVSGISIVQIKKGTGRHAPRRARFVQSRYVPAVNASKMPAKII